MRKTNPEDGQLSNSANLRLQQEAPAHRNVELGGATSAWRQFGDDSTVSIYITQQSTMCRKHEVVSPDNSQPPTCPVANADLARSPQMAG